MPPCHCCKEGYTLFAKLMQAINQHTVSNLMRIQIVREDELARMEEEQRIQRERQMAQAKRVERQDGEGKR